MFAKHLNITGILTYL